MEFIKLIDKFVDFFERNTIVFWGLIVLVLLFVFVGVYTCQLSNCLKKEISARKKVELYSSQKALEVKELISKFSESEEKFRSIFHSAIVGIAMTDSHGKFILSNETWNRMLGYTDQEMKNLTNLDITHPDDLDTTRQYSEGLVSGKIQYLRIEKRYITKSKATIWVDLSISKVNLNDGTHFFGIMTDITDKKKIGFELEKLATVDILTSLLNRRAIQPIIDKEMYRRKRFDHPVSLMVIDIDHFKKINDEYGHASGDKVLSSIANKIK